MSRTLPGGLKNKIKGSGLPPSFLSFLYLVEAAVGKNLFFYSRLMKKEEHRPGVKDLGSRL